MNMHAFNKLSPGARMAWRLALVLGALCHGLAAHALDVVDDRGTTVHFAKSPQRIVSILPSLTETVCELGQCHRLVGVDRYSNFPESVRKLPVVGGGLDPSIEAIVALKPDVVLMAVSARAGDRLQALGIPVVALEPKSGADVQRILTKLGQLLEVPDAQRIWRTIDAGVGAAAQSLPPKVKNVRVYFEVSPGPYAAGESSFMGETMKRLGVQNIVPASLGPFPKLNPEFVVRANPDLVMIGERNAANLENRPGWDGIRALRERKVCRFPSEQGDILVRPGPRMAEAARIMAACITRHFP